jgi:hypothetical protein
MREMAENIELLYPLYLNISMMISFVAAMDGGYSLEKVWKQTNDTSGEISGTLEGEAGLSSIVSALVKAHLKASGNVDGKLTSSEESQIVFKHTEASLFMRLRHELHHQKRIISLDDYGKKQWETLSPSTLVEISGEIRRSPVNEIVQISKRFIPIMLQSLPFNKDGNVDIVNLSDDQRRFLQSMSSVQGIVADLETSPLTDALLVHEGEWKKTAVLDISTKVLPLSDQELLHCGHVTVIGKATHILTEQETINLYRRSVLGIAAQSVSDQIAQSFNSVPEVIIKLETPIVSYPAVEIIPMAIYV